MSKFHHATDKSNINLLEWVDMFYFFCLGFTCLLISSHQRSFVILFWNSAHSAIPEKKKTTRYFKFIKISEKVNN